MGSKRRSTSKKLFRQQIRRKARHALNAGLDFFRSLGDGRLGRFQYGSGITRKALREPVRQDGVKTEPTDRVLQALSAGECPDCGGMEFLRGPSGGVAVNIKCARCQSKFNVAETETGLFFAERI